MMRAHVLLILYAAGCLIGHSPLGADSPWPRHTIDASHRGADGVRLADFNGDQRLDVVTGWEESGLVKLYLNPGPDGAREEWPAAIIARAKSPEDAVPIDLDQDGRMDILSSHEGKQQQLLVHWNNCSNAKSSDEQLLRRENWKTESFPDHDGIQWMFATPLGKIDSRVAFVAGSKGTNATITLLISPQSKPRDLQSWQSIVLRDVGWIMSMQAIDMDHDGDLDVVFSDRKGSQRGAAWLEQPDEIDAEWVEHKIAGQGREVMFLSATPERCLIALRDGAFLKCDRNNQSWKTDRIPNPDQVFNGKAIVALPDDRIILTANTYSSKHKNRPGIWIRDTAGTWSAIDTIPANKFDRMELIDLDGDGDLDVMTCEERQNLGVIWYENPG